MALARSSLDPPAGGKARRTYDALVTATRDTVAATGTFSAETVAERAGMATATFYAYFSSKDDALAAAFDQVLHENNERLADALSIEALLDRGLEPLLENLAVVAIHAFKDNALMFRLALSRLSEHRTIRDAYRRRERDALEVIERFVQLGTAAGRLRAGDQQAMATALLVLLQGFNNPILLHRDDRDPVVRELVVVLEHLLAR